MPQFIDHPRVALVVGLVLGGLGIVAQRQDAWALAWICWGLALLVVLWSAITSSAVRDRSTGFFDSMPFEVRVTRRHSEKRLPAEIEKGFLDYERDFMAAADEAPQFLTEINSETTFQTYLITESIKRMVKSQGAPVASRLRVTRGIAGEVESGAKRLENLEREYRAACDRMILSSKGLLRTTPATTDLSPLEATFKELRKTYIEMRDATRTTRATFQGSRQMNVSQDVNRAYDRYIAVLDKLIGDAENNVTYSNDAMKLLIARKQGSGR